MKVDGNAIVIFSLLATNIYWWYQLKLSKKKKKFNNNSWYIILILFSIVGIEFSKKKNNIYLKIEIYFSMIKMF